MHTSKERKYRIFLTQKEAENLMVTCAQCTVDQMFARLSTMKNCFALRRISVIVNEIVNKYFAAYS